MQTVKSRADLQPAKKEEARPDPMVAVNHALTVLAQQSANAMHAVTALAEGQAKTHAELLAIAAARVPPKRLDCEVIHEGGKLKRIVITPVR